jgi:hypothetical protein
LALLERRDGARTSSQESFREKEDRGEGGAQVVRDLHDEVQTVGAKEVVAKTTFVGRFERV